MEPIEMKKENAHCNAILLHYGELALKGDNRHLFEARLMRNITTALHEKSACAVRRLPGRIWIDFAESPIPEMAVTCITRVFGVANVAPALRVDPDLEKIRQAVALLVEGDSFASFAIRTRRGEKTFPMNSVEVNCDIGRFVGEMTQARVDLDRPEREIAIEILDRHAFVSTRRFAGPGGLPVGCAGKVACLISGGIDSPVAAWRMMKRGCSVIYLHFFSAPFTSRASVEKVVDLVEQLSIGIKGVNLIVIPFGEIQKEIVTKTPEEVRILLYRRLMVRIAEVIAREEGCEALVTGEVLSQVASQTLSNLAAIESVATMPVLRPLLGMDKQEIVDEAKRIGTFQTACEPHDDCCSFLVPTHPATKMSIEKLDRMESMLDVARLVQKGITEKEVHALRH
ncbi:MAG: tRNA 4-thiouridine(8) synthase ThiI [Deltaproteobacteria bacterium]|nr:tRNA 4-thiouridine(8) synthase ThiI [Deltaproteobacteria bacterium]